METKSEQNALLECQKWLNPANVRENHQRHVSSKLNGTCEWIWTNADFLAWFSSSSSSWFDRLLCISGMHGCGKSVLASSINDGLKAKGRGLLMFYFSSTDERSQTLNHLARSIIWQLLEESAGRAINTVRSVMAKGPPTTSDLWSTAASLIKLDAKRYCLVIDGIDESSDLEQGNHEPIERLLQDCPNLTIILLGRPHAFNSMSQATQHPMIRIDPQITKEDTDTLIALEVDKSDLLRNIDLKDNVVNVLQSKSEGMFLWIRLMAEELRKSSSRFQVTERLQNLPRGLEEAYSLIFSRIYQRADQHDLLLVQIILSFIIVARRPITAHELNYIYALETQSRAGCETAPLGDFLLSNPEESVTRMCGDLVSASGGSIRLIHSSLRDFLTRSESYWSRTHHHELAVFRVSEQQTHALLGWQCLRYLNMGDYGQPLQDPDSVESIRQSNPLIEYASIHTMNHLRTSDSGDRKVIDELNRLAGSPHFDSWFEHLLITFFEHEFELSLLEDMQSFEDWVRRQPGSSKELITRLDQAFDDAAQHSFADFLEGDALDIPPETIEEPDNSSGHNLCAAVSTSGSGGSEAVRATPSPQQVAAQESRPNNGLHGPGVGISSIPPQHTAAAMQQALHMIVTTTPARKRHQIAGLGVVALMSFSCVSTRKATRLMRDALTALFQILINKTLILPVYTLPVVAACYNRFDRYEQALEICKMALPRTSDISPRIESFTLAQMGASFYGLHQHDEALEHLELALKYVPCNSIEQTISLSGRDLLGHVRFDMQRYDDALQAFTEAAAGRDEVLGKEDKFTLESHYNVGKTLSFLERNEEARDVLSRTLKLQEKLLGMDDLNVIQTRDDLAFTFFQLKLYEEGLECFEDTCERLTRIKGEQHWQSLSASDFRGRTLYQLGRYEEAVTWLRKAALGREKLEHTNEQRKCEMYDFFAFALRRVGGLDEARVNFDKAIALASKFYKGSQRSAILRLRTEHIKVLTALERFDEVRAQSQRIVELSRDLYGDKHEQTVNAELAYADALLDNSQHAAALEHYERFFSARKDMLPKDDIDILMVRLSVAVAQRCLWRYSDAHETLKEILPDLRLAAQKSHNSNNATYYSLDILKECIPCAIELMDSLERRLFR